MPMNERHDTEHGYQVYIDNFDEMRSRAAADGAGVDIESEWSQALMAAAGVRNVPYSDEKRVKQAIMGESLGGRIQGSDGIIGPSPQRRSKLA